MYSIIYYFRAGLTPLRSDGPYFRAAFRSLSSFTTVYREMRAKLLPPILVYVLLWLHRLPKAQTWQTTLKSQGKIEFSVGGLALVSFFHGIRTIKFGFSWWHPTAVLLYVVSLN